MKKTYTILLLILYVNLSALNYSKVINNYRGRSAYNNKQFDKSTQIFEKNAIDNVSNGKLSYNLGNSYYKSNDFEKAIKQYNISLLDKNLKNRSDIYQNIGNTHFKNENLQESREAYIKAIVEDQNNSLAKKNLEFVNRIIKKKQEEQKMEDKDSKKENKKSTKGQNQQNKEDQNQKSKEEQNQQEEKRKGDSDKQNEKKESEHKKMEKKIASKILDKILEQEKINRLKKMNKKGEIPSNGKYW